MAAIPFQMASPLPTSWAAPQSLQAMPAPQPAGPYVQSQGNQQLIGRVQGFASQLPNLKNWNVVILPDQQWQTIQQQLGPQYNREHPTDKAFSIMGANRTYLKESWLLKNRDDDVQEALAHEYAHLSLNTKDEGTAVKWAKQWLKNRK